jgi:glycosyltransferase involved in cell wall biosynthesis
MREMASLGHKVCVISAEWMDSERADLGWNVTAPSDIKIIVESDPNTIRSTVKNSPQDAIHLVAGARCIPMGGIVVRECVSYKRHVGIISEAPDPRGFSGLLRRIRYGLERYGKGRSFEFILAMGRIGVEWFGSCGYPSFRIFPFAYAVDWPEVCEEPVSRVKPKAIYVGRLIKLKGVDLLLKAIKYVPEIELTVVGDGAESTHLKKYAERLGLSARTKWLGNVHNEEIGKLVSAHDVLVLPSRKDGWGTVINESLMVGTPVICSTACGASELIVDPKLGSVFESKDVEGLKNALLDLVAKGPVTGNDRADIRDWATSISAKSVAHYLNQVLMHVYEGEPRPLAPWRAGGTT